jgi:tellurium resistance protein TerD
MNELKQTFNERMRLSETSSPRHPSPTSYRPRGPRSEAALGKGVPRVECLIRRRIRVDGAMAEMKRGANVALTREVPGLNRLVFGIGWNAGSEHVLDENLVFAAILCGTDGRARSDHDFVFFNQLSSPDESVQQREAALGGDREQIEVDLGTVPADVDRIVVVLYINEGPAQRRTLGQLRSCVIRILDGTDNRELVRSEELASAFSAETAVALGEIYRHDGWKFKVLGQGYSKGIAGLAADYRIPL